MNSVARSITKIYGGAVKAYESFPAAILSALAFAIVTIVRITLDWPAQEPYNFLFNCLHWSFAVGAVFGMAAITIAQSRFNSKRAFLIANLLCVFVAAATFLLLYLLGGTTVSGLRYSIVSALAASRVSVLILISFLVFIVAASYPKEQSDFARSFFMTQKAFLIALIYGIVIMAGVSGVAGAVQALLYHGMSTKVYMYIGTLSGFLAFTIFLGYFPDFRKGNFDEHREIAQKQPRFIEILLGYIITPIILALTVVLLLWSGRTILTGAWPVFTQLSRIAIAYSFGGLWLHIMVTHYESGLTNFYRRVYPFAALIILAFEAAALYAQLEESGLKITEYLFIVVWVVAAAAAILLLLLKAGAHRPIVVITCAAAIFAVLPVMGFHALPVAAQVGRLENLLTNQKILENNQLVPASSEPELVVRESITDAVYYIAGAEDAKVPVWFDKKLNDSDVFKEKLGFEPVWPNIPEDYNGTGGYMGTSLYLKPEAIDVSNYTWGIILQENSTKEGKATTIKGDKGVYSIDWRMNSNDGIPSLKVKLGDQVLLDRDMKGYLDKIAGKYPPGSRTEPVNATLQDMSLMLETREVTVLLVFSNIEINVKPQTDQINYWLNLSAVYLKEK